MKSGYNRDNACEGGKGGGATVAKIKPLKDNVLFKDFSDGELAVLAKFVEEKTVAAPTPLFLENMKGTSMYIMVSGAVQLTKMLSEGETRTLTTLGPGEFFGEMALVEEGPRQVSAFVAKDSNILVIKRTEFEKLMEESPKVAVKVVIGMYKTLSDRVRQSSPKIQQLLMGQA
jgi:CRP/FNR family transcriptional regulator, cyclic AMP receptor protein